MDAENSETNSEKKPLPEALERNKFKPGQSGNPGGRPKKRMIDEVLAELLETNDSADALAVATALLVKAKKGDVKAAQIVAERTQGKPSQSLRVSGSIELANKSDEELKSMLQQLVAKL